MAPVACELDLKKAAAAVGEAAQLHDAILFSGGRIGCQVEMSLGDLDALVGLTFADIPL